MLAPPPAHCTDLGEEVEERRGEPGRGGEDELAAEVERQWTVSLPAAGLKGGDSREDTGLGISSET